MKNQSFDDAIEVFKKQKKDRTEWYMGKEKVSIAMICEQEDFIKSCDWAIHILEKEKCK